LIDGVDRGLIGEGMLRDHGTQRRDIDAAFCQGGVETAPAPPVERCRTQMHRRGDGFDAQEGINQVAERGRAPGETGVECRSEGAQWGERIGSHDVVSPINPRVSTHPIPCSD
jgi:hypothetical protein